MPGHFEGEKKMASGGHVEMGTHWVGEMTETGSTEGERQEEPRVG